MKMMNEPRARTAEDLRSDFLSYLKTLVVYWDDLPDKTSREKLDGLCFSILSIFDGTSIAFPAADIVMRPHPDDRQFHIDNNEDWIEDGTVINDTIYTSCGMSPLTPRGKTMNKWKAEAALIGFRWIISDDSGSVAQTLRDDEVFARQIVREHNAHDDLVEALNLTLAKVLQYMTFLDNQHSPAIQEVIRAAESALAKAKAKAKAKEAKPV